MNLASWYEGEPATVARMNGMTNDINSLAAGSTGLAVITATGSWVVPNGITSTTRLRIWVVGSGNFATSEGGGEDPVVVTPGAPAKWAYTVMTGFSAGQSVPVVVGPTNAATAAAGKSSFNSVSIYANGLNGSIGGTAPAGVYLAGAKFLAYGAGETWPYAGTGPGAIIIEW